jgi:hypothetical protein
MKAGAKWRKFQRDVQKAMYGPTSPSIDRELSEQIQTLEKEVRKLKKKIRKMRKK